MTSEPEVGFGLIRDDDGHWYVIPWREEPRFNAWLKAVSENSGCGGSDEDWKYFEGCRVDGPHRVVFHSWRERP